MKMRSTLECGREAAALPWEFPGGSFAAALQGTFGAQIFQAAKDDRKMPYLSGAGAFPGAICDARGGANLGKGTDGG